MQFNKHSRGFSKFIGIAMAISIVFSSGLLGINLSYAEIDTDFLEEVSELIQENYIYNVDDSKLENAAINGMLSSLDPYSRYYTKEQYELEVENSSGQFAGVGISMRIDGSTGYILVEQVYEDMPAIKAGIKDGDLITHVDGKVVQGLTVDEAALMIRGEAGEPVVFTVQRKGHAEPFVIKVVRENVKFSSVEAEFEEADNIIYFYIAEFNDGVAADLKKALKDMKKQHPNAKGVMLDLRFNPGGFVDEAVKIADMFLPKGTPIYHALYKNRDSDTEYAKEKPIWEGKLAVLISKDSASASELLAGALQDAGVARVFGTKSFGKGIMQGTVEYEDGSAIDLTIAEYVTGSKHKVHKVGITPDELVIEAPVLQKKEYAPMSENKTYKFGQMGLNIYGAQQRLIDLGYDVKANGIYDEKMLLAMQKFEIERVKKTKGMDITDSAKTMKFDLTPKFCNNINEDLIQKMENPSNYTVDKAVEWIKEVKESN